MPPKRASLAVAGASASTSNPSASNSTHFELGEEQRQVLIRHDDDRTIAQAEIKILETTNKKHPECL
jgi:hypothetical protein